MLNKLPSGEVRTASKVFKQSIRVIYPYEWVNANDLEYKHPYDQERRYMGRIEYIKTPLREKRRPPFPAGALIPAGVKRDEQQRDELT